MKKLAVIFSFLVLYIFCLLSNRPVLYGYAEKIEICLENNASSSKMITVNNDFSLMFTRIYGETVIVEKPLSYIDVFSKFNAILVATEEVSEGISYYGYSNKIKYCEYIDGKKVNLHVFEGKQTKIGTPIIYGGY